MQQTDCKNLWYSEFNTRRHQLTLFLLFSLLLSKLLSLLALILILHEMFFFWQVILLWVATGFLNHYKAFTLLLYAIHIEENQQTHMCVEFVGSLLCTKRFSPGTSVSPLLKKPAFDFTCVNCYFEFTVSPISPPALEWLDTEVQCSQQCCVKASAAFKKQNKQLNVY